MQQPQLQDKINMQVALNACVEKQICFVTMHHSGHDFMCSESFELKCDAKWDEDLELQIQSIKKVYVRTFSYTSALSNSFLAY